MRVTNQAPEWSWLPSDPQAIWINAQNQSYRVMYTFLTDHRIEEISPEHNQLFRELALAYTKRILGQVRKKFPLPLQGGGTIEIDGKAMYEESKADLDRINKTLMTMIPPILTTPPIQ